MSKRPLETDNNTEHQDQLKRQKQENTNGNHHVMEDKLAYEDRNSRVIAAVGAEALKKFQTTNVLLIGLKGLGAEIAKNVTLFGVKMLTLHDPTIVTVQDFSSNFLLNEKDIGKSRADACLPKLLELNDRVNVQVHSGDLDEKFLSQFKVVVATNIGSRSRLVELNELCRKSGVLFIGADTFGLFGSIFVDFGDSFSVSDKDGEQPKQAYIQAITQDKEGTVQVVDSKRHDLEDGELVKIFEVEGMSEVNERQYRVNVTGPFTFQIKTDTTSFTPYKKGGQVVQVKEPINVRFSPLKKSFEAPEWDKVLVADDSRDRRFLYVLIYQALLEFQETHKGQLPRPYNEEDATAVLKLVEHFNSQSQSKVDKIEEQVVRLASFTAAGDLNPMAAFFGGIIGQEVIKGATSKYQPIPQFFCFDSFECLPTTTLTAADIRLENSRYDGQIAVFGNQFVDKIKNLRYFLVGSGAIGCEMLKNWAMMGVGCGPNGLVQLTDNDTIEVSNLSRQFLFRPWDVTKFKAQVAASAAQRMNPAMHTKAYTMKVAEDTESTFNDDFWSHLSGVCNALDNVQARLYVDRRCIFYGLSLLESGTLGTKGNVQVVVPHLTESYGSSQDPPPKETALCLLHSFPNNIQHCLQWAREVLFEGFFSKDMEIVNQFVTKRSGYIESLVPTQRFATLKTLEADILNKPKSFEECITWARLVFEEYYTNRLVQLLHVYPPDMLTESKVPFWSGAKRAPTPLHFDVDNQTHLDFVVSASFMRAYTFGLIDSEYKPKDMDEWIKKIRKHLSTVHVPKFVPKGNVKIDTDEKKTKETEGEAPALSNEEEQEAELIIKKLPVDTAVKLNNCKVIEFEKDDDRNFHVDFIAAASNLRATAYKIQTVDRLESKLIAGKIIPAIVTTTALVTGLVCLEMYKIHQGHTKIDVYRNAFVNLALPLFRASEPLPPAKMKFQEKDFTLWDKVIIKKANVTLKDLLAHLQKELNVEVDVLSIGALMLYTSWMAKQKREERLPKKVTDIVAEMTQKPLDPSVTYLQLNITGSDSEGKDIEHIPEVWLQVHAQQ